jgi:hypothetical protein
MSIIEMMIKEKGVWYLKLKDGYKMVIDLDNNEWDSYEWYEYYGELNQVIYNIEMVESLIKKIKECKKLK